VHGWDGGRRLRCLRLDARLTYTPPPLSMPPSMTRRRSASFFVAAVGAVVGGRLPPTSSCGEARTSGERLHIAAVAAAFLDGHELAPTLRRRRPHQAVWPLGKPGSTSRTSECRTPYDRQTLNRLEMKLILEAPWLRHLCGTESFVPRLRCDGSPLPFFTSYDLLLSSLFCGSTVAAVPGIKVNGANLIDDIVG